MYNKIKAHLDTQFIQTEHVSRTLSLAFQGKKNCILWGRAGLAKSEMVTSVIAGLNYKDDTFIQFFGEGMSEDRLYGGLNIKKFTDESVQEYQPERSFLNYKYAIFEELFDAPAMALLALKDTLTAGKMRNGMQQYPMKTQTIIAITNRAPSEISELGTHCHALIERFPIQLEVEWDNYNKSNYLAMFNKVKSDASDYLCETLADLIHEVNNDGGFISPRSAVHALDTLIIATEQGMDEDETFQCLMYVPGFEKVMKDIKKKIEYASIRRQATQQLDKAEAIIISVNKNIARETDPLVCLKANKELGKMMYAIQHNMRTPDELTERRDGIVEQIKNTCNILIERARELTPDADEWNGDDVLALEAPKDDTTSSDDEEKDITGLTQIEQKGTYWS